MEHALKNGWQRPDVRRLGQMTSEVGNRAAYESPTPPNRQSDHPVGLGACAPT